MISLAATDSRIKLDELLQLERSVERLTDELDDFVKHNKHKLRDSSELELAIMLSTVDNKKDQLKLKINKLKRCLYILSGNTEQPDTIKLLLIGRTGCGKSKLGNTLLGRDSFKVGETLESETKAGSTGYTESGGRKYMVVDTIGLNDSKLSEEEVSEILFNTLLEFGGEVNGCLICVPSDRLDGTTVQHMKSFIFEFLGQEVLRNSMLVLTKCGKNFFMRVEELKEKVMSANCLDFLRGMTIVPTECGKDDSSVAPSAYMKYLTPGASITATDWSNEINVTKGLIFDNTRRLPRVRTRKIHLLLEEGYGNLKSEIEDFIKQVRDSTARGQNILFSFRHASFGRKILMGLKSVIKVVKSVLL